MSVKICIYSNSEYNCSGEFFIIYLMDMQFIKKICITLLSILWFSIISFWYCLDTPGPSHMTFVWDSSPVIDNQDIVDINEWWRTFTDKLEWILHFPQKDEYTTSLWYVTSLIQVLINWLLWILAFVALIYMLYCGFLVFSSWSDDKDASKGKKWIYTAAIALAWIWLSWLIISAMIWFITLISAGD